MPVSIADCPTNRMFTGIKVITDVIAAQAKIRIEAITHLKVIKVVIETHTRVFLGKDSGFIYIIIARSIRIIRVGIVKSVGS